MTAEERKAWNEKLMAKYPTVGGRPVVRFTFDLDKQIVFVYVETTRLGRPAQDRLVFCDLVELADFKPRTPSRINNGN